MDSQDTATPEGTEDTDQAGPDPLSYAVARYRDMVAATPGLVPEMVGGSTIEEVDAAAQAARQAYEAVSRQLAAEYEAHVPAGNPARSSSETAESLRPEAKIALGLKGR